MGMFVAALIFVALLAVSIAHLLWALGRTWPIKNEMLLAQTVVGTPGVTRMPPRLASLAVAVATLAAGIVALALADRTGGGLPLDLAGVLLAALFAARGVVGYTGNWRKRFPTEPFATLDRRNYSPLCLALGAGFLVLVVMRFL
jgi:hypothetical protein